MSDQAALEDFATLLTTMKERSGRTYDSLARRAGTSSSALHRYCSGQAVPAEFGVLERLGRVLGADRATLFELHRRWALALAARERVTAPPPTPRPGPPRPVRPARPMAEAVTVAERPEPATVAAVATVGRAPVRGRETAVALAALVLLAGLWASARSWRRAVGVATGAPVAGGEAPADRRRSSAATG